MREVGFSKTHNYQLLAIQSKVNAIKSSLGNLYRHPWVNQGGCNDSKQIPQSY